MSSSIEKKNDYSEQNVEVSSYNGDHANLAKNPHRGLGMRQVQLIAISGSIGGALFVSIGGALSNSGPLGLVLGLIFWCTVVFSAANCLIEPTTYLPIDGGFVQLGSRFVDSAFGCALGWNYFITQVALVCFELTAMNVIAEYWSPGLNPAIIISVGLVCLAIANLWSVRWFGEIEFWISLSKIILVFMLTMYTFVTMLGGNPLKDRYGYRFWRDPGVFGVNKTPKDRIRAIFDAMVWSVFAVVGPDYLSLISGEVKNPRRIVPRAYKTTFYRIVGFYVIGALCVGTVCSSVDEGLLGDMDNASRSPYVISMNRLKIKVLPDIVNAIVLISIFSTANSFIYTGSRGLVGLADRGQAPKFVAKENRNGVPYISVLICLAISCLSYMSVSAGAAKVLNWWISLVSSAQLITWTCIGILSVRFRAGVTAQNLWNRIPVKGWFMPYCSWWVIFWAPITFIFSGYFLFLPGSFDATTFVFNYGSGFIFLFIYLVAKGVDFVRGNRRFLIPPSEMDLTSGVAEIEEMTEQYEEQRAMKHKTFMERVSYYIFRD